MSSNNIITEPIDLATDSSKRDKNWLKAQIDYSIYSAINPYRDDFIKAYQVLNGERSEDEFEYITKTYGIEFPARMTNIPLVKTLLDALVGEERGMPLSHKIAVKDIKSLEDIRRNKNLSILQKINQQINEIFKQNLQTVLNDEKSPLKIITEEMLDDINEFHTYSWRDMKVVAAEKVKQHLVDKLEMSRQKNVMFRDLLATGTEFYRCRVLEMGRDPDFMYLNPINISWVSNNETPYLKDCERVVYKEYLTRSEIINRYGHKMTAEDRQAILDKAKTITFSGMSIYNDAFRLASSSSYKKNTIGQYAYHELIEVNHVEFKVNTRVVIKNGREIELQNQDQMVDGTNPDIKVRFRLDRYEGIRIGNSIYLDMGMSKHVVRPKDNPWYCSLTFNGILYNARNGRPFSMVLETKDLQDKYNILNYYLENLVALSGTKGTRVILENIPKQFGETITERIKKFMYYKKNGLEIYSLSQDGSQEFNNYGTYDDSLSDSVRVILEMMQYVESVASRITGVTPQRTGAIGKNELVGNTEIAVNMSVNTTKALFSAHNDLLKHALSDLVNNAAYSWKKSPKKVLVLGDMLSEVFTLDSENFGMSDYDAFWSDSGLEIKQLEELRNSAREMVAGQLIDIESFIDISTINDITELKRNLKNSVRKGRNKKIQEAEQQLKQLDEQLKEATNKLKQLESQNMDIKKKELDMKERETEKTLSLKEKEIEEKSLREKEKIALEKERVRLEQMQMTFNEKSFEVKNK